MSFKVPIGWQVGVFAFLSGVAIWFPAPWDYVGARFVIVHALAGLLSIGLVLYTAQKRLLALGSILLLVGTAGAFANTEGIREVRSAVVGAHMVGGLLLLLALAPSAGSRFLRSGGGMAALVVLTAGLLAAMPLRRPELPVDHAPFAPADARTATGGVLDISLINDSQLCAQCHPAIAEEWRSSMHGAADIRDPFYMPAHDLMDEVYNQIEPGRYCSSCHNPGLLLSGKMVTPASPREFKRLRDSIPVEEKYREAGISCLACHGQLGNDLRGNGSYLLTHPQEAWFGLKSGGLLGMAESAAIRIRSDWHRGAMRPPGLDRPEFCASCHTQTVDERLNGFGYVKIRSEYEEWLGGYRGGLPSENPLVCVNCHMPLVEAPDPSNRSGKHRSHRFIAAHTALPHVQGDATQLELTTRFLRGENDPPEIADRWPKGPIVTMNGYASPATFGRRIVIGLTNVKVGHSFPAGTITFADCWVEIVVTDREGRVIFQDGVRDAAGRHTAAFRLFGTLIDKDGNRLTRAQTFLAVGMGERRAIPPGYTEKQSYRVGHRDGFPWTVSARLHYRKIAPQFQSFAMPESKSAMPVVTLAETIFTVE